MDSRTRKWHLFRTKGLSSPFFPNRVHHLPVVARLLVATILSVCVLALHRGGSPVLQSRGSVSLPQPQVDAHRKLVQTPEDAFTIIFVSDLESRYRNHSPLRCQYVLRYIRDLAQEKLYFAAPYADARIDPKLIIHGGDNYHMLGCENSPFYLCRSVYDEWSTVWKTTFATPNAVPLISAFGNHDWQTAPGTGIQSASVWGSYGAPQDALRTNTINQRAQELVTQTYQESAKLGVEYQAFTPEGKIGPSFYRASFRGVQIASFNCATFWESYDDRGVFDNDAMFNALAASLDREQTTVFFQHYPLSDHPPEAKAKTVNLIGEFPRAVHLSGHVHISRADKYGTFTDYVAPYPHFWIPDRAPGFYALLVSPSEGILQVQEIAIPGLPDGTPCTINDSCQRCDSGEDFWYSANEYRCGREPSLPPGAFCFSFFWGCDACPDDAGGNPNFYCPWYGLFLFFCSCTTNVRVWDPYSL